MQVLGSDSRRNYESNLSLYRQPLQRQSMARSAYENVGAEAADRTFRGCSSVGAGDIFS